MLATLSRSWFALLILGVCAAGLGLVAMLGAPMTAPINAAGPAQRYAEIPFDGRAALTDLTRLCDLGPRPTASDGMRRQQELLIAHFQGLGAKVTRQAFRMRSPFDGSLIDGANLLVEWDTEAKERVLLCAHYDTRPYPDRDQRNPRGLFVGANDGASGTAVLMELGRHIAATKGRRGVDFVLFDAEEYVFDERHEYFIGSKFFAQTYKAQPPAYRYRCGLLLDMVGDAQLFIRKEPVSARHARFVLDEVWAAAVRIGVREFGMQFGTEVRDDHVPLNEIAQIPTVDLIDFDYPYWHTEADRPDKCSAASLEKVGKVVFEWLRTVRN